MSSERLKLNVYRPLVGIGVVVVKEGKILLGKRKSAHGSGTWSTPGGHLEYGESPELCAMRELEEETSLKALSLHLGPWTNTLIEEGKHYITLFIFVDRFEGEPISLELDKCDEWKWFDWDHLPSPLFPTIYSLIDKVGIESLKKLFL